MAILLVVILFSFCTAMAQPPSGIHWSKNGNGYYTYANCEISYNNLLDNSKLVVINKTEILNIDFYFIPVFLRTINEGPFFQSCFDLI